MSLKSEDKILAGISHLGIFLNVVGFVGVLIIYLVKKEASHFVRDHAKQALGYQVIILIISWMITLIFMGGAIGGIVSGTIFNLPQIMPGFMGSMIIFGIIRGGLSLLIFGYAVYAAIQALQGKGFKYVVIGEFVDRI